ncbi:hypothetical protein LSTR_LSTR000356 [Laodelphax striatellus]|uniref:Uncharacterized protein n=1 Tax=Laodelphax striatellus TaxID=195883 RepID=A0A482X3U6_LAOST|nr:hypothetical protein LSTR_LSTR000356 [Laodelphax striatellus]
MSKTLSRMTTGVPRCKVNISEASFSSSDSYILECLVCIRDRARSAETRGEIHGYRTRQTRHINMPRCRLARTQKCYPFIALKMYNRLPGWIKESRSDRHFRAVLKSFIVDHPFYSLSEFFDAEMTF